MIHKAKKSLGQNFIKSETALKKMLEAGEVSGKDIVLEIGPGKGKLTKKLLEKSGYVIAIEKDRELFEFLKIKFSKEIKDKKLILLNEDILKSNISNILKREDSFNFELPEGPNPYSGKGAGTKNWKNLPDFNFDYKIIANIPYNITGAILKKFLTEEKQPERMVLMVQNEVAKRICGENSTSSKLQKTRESVLSISVKAYGEPKIIMKVPARYFSPAPKVDSAIISIKNISRKIFIKNKIGEKIFWEIVHAGFAHKRKKLSSNLKNHIDHVGNSYVVGLENKRAEELSTEDWVKLVKMIDPDSRF